LDEASKLAMGSGPTEHVSGETFDAARSWSHRRRVSIKAEVVRRPGRAPTCTPRCVVTNLREAPAAGSANSCQRGDVENRLKELQEGLALGRTRGSRFWAKQFRGLLTAAAAVLRQEWRRRAAGTVCAQAQVATVRASLLKLAVWVEGSGRRLVRPLPRVGPWAAAWRRVACAVGAAPR
jgi:hypothetical protein